MTSVWRGFLDEVLHSVTFHRKKLMIIDVSDCSRRFPDEIREMAGMVKEFGEFFTVVFSLNLNESLLICKAFDKSPDSAAEISRTVYDVLRPHALVLHLLDGAFLHDESGITSIPAIKITSPKISTGGGDNFNAGLTMALLAGMGYGESVAVANAASGFYISNGRSASIQELLAYISNIGG